MSFKRHIFMILGAEYQDLNVAVKMTMLGKDYTIFITTDSMRCFVCGNHGHTRQKCPTKKDAEQVNHENDSVTVNEQVNHTPEENNETKIDQHSKKVGDCLSEPSSAGCVDNSDAVPIVTHVLIENVAGDSVEIQDGAEPAVVDSARDSEHFGEQMEVEEAVNLMNSQDVLENDGHSL